MSLLFALGGPELMLEIRRAHDASVAAALGYLEREAGEVRRGKDGVGRLPGGGFVAAAFRHRTSRAGDPQLHTHVLVTNLTHGADGRFSALDGQQLYAQAKTVPVSPYADRSFAAGDLVIARRNDYRHGLINGERGVVTEVDTDAETLTVQLAGRRTTVPAEYLAGGGLDYGYALTVHQSQGMTCERALLLGSDALYREAGYVGLSRGRQRNDLHLVDRPAEDDPAREDRHAPRRPQPEVEDALAAVGKALTRSRAQALALDMGR